MSSNVINFLRQRKKDLSEVQLVDKKYAIWSGYLILFIFLAMILVVGVDYFFTTRTQTIQSRQKEVQSKISSYAAVEKEYVALAKKLELISTLLTSRDERRDAIIFITKLFSQEEAILKELQIDSDGILRFQIVSKNVFVMNQTMKRLQQDDIRQQFDSLAMTDLSRNQNGEYSVEVSVVISQKK